MSSVKFDVDLTDATRALHLYQSIRVTRAHTLEKTVLSRVDFPSEMANKVSHATSNREAYFCLNHVLLKGLSKP